MVRKYYAKTILEGLMYDVKVKLDNGAIEDAYDLINTKMDSIKKMIDSPHHKVLFTE